MTSTSDTITNADCAVWVRRQWNDSRSITVRFADLQRPHWSETSGGVCARANRPYIHGYISCDLIPDGAEFGHSCLHGPGPHRIKVCIVAKDNERRIMTLLKQAARPPA